MNPRTRDKAGLNGPAVILLGLAVAAMIAWLVATAAGFVREDLERNDFTRLGQAGEFLNFAYGVPIAAAGVLLGILTTVVAYQVASKQGDIQLLEFATDRTQPAIVLFKRLMGAIGRLAYLGVAAREVATNLLDDIRQDRDQLPDVLEALGRIDEWDSVDAVENILTGSETPHRQWLLFTMAALVQEVRKVSAEINDGLQAINEDLFASHFIRRQSEILRQTAGSASRDPLAYLRDKFPSRNTGPIPDFSTNLFDVAVNIRHYLSVTSATEILAAAVTAPEPKTLADHLVYVARPKRLILERLERVGDREVGGFGINLTAAYILWLLQRIPDRDAVLQDFDGMSGRRSEPAKRFLASVIPYKSDYAAPFVLEGFEPCYEDFDRLIVIDVYKDDRFHQEFYDDSYRAVLERESSALAD